MGESGRNVEAFLPEDFLERTRERGYVVESWAPQVDILNHPAVGGIRHALRMELGAGSNVTEGAPVVPISAQLKYNIVVVCEYIVKKIPIPERNFVAPPRVIVIRSFDVNKPGFEVDEIRGGVAGRSILMGVLRVNQMIEVRPGHVDRDESGNIKCMPYYSRIVSLYAEQNELQFAVSRGLIGVGTTLLRGLLGVRTRESESKRWSQICPPVNIGSMSTDARVIAVRNDLAKFQLTSPVCTSRGEKIALRWHIERHWRRIGWGTIQAGITLDVPPVQF